MALPAGRERGKLTAWAGRPVLYDGRPISFAEAFPLLLALAENQRSHRLLLECDEHPHLHPPVAAGSPELERWSVCPIDLCLSPHYRAVFELDELAQVAPLARWPDAYPFWAVHGLRVLRRERREFEVRRRQNR